MIRRGISRRELLTLFVGRREVRRAEGDARAPRAGAAGGGLPGLVPPGEVFSLEAFYRARAADRAAPLPDEEEP